MYFSGKELSNGNRFYKEREKERDFPEKQAPRGWGPGHDEARDRNRFGPRRMIGRPRENEIRNDIDFDKKFKYENKETENVPPQQRTSK